MAHEIRASSSGRFGVLDEEWAGHRLIVLEDREAGSTAILVPSLGFACISFRVATADGPWPVLAEPPDGTALIGQTTRYGIPILFPWPNRIRDSRFTFGGQEYWMPAATGSPHANHGLARQRAWTVEGVDARDDGATCRSSVSIGTGDDPWPFPMRLSVQYRLARGRLTLTAEARNTGRAAAPMGFGIHPWFPLPLGPQGTRDRCEIRVPARGTWELTGLIPTGRILPVSDAPDLRNWRPLGGLVLDDVYTGLPIEAERFTAEVRDLDSGRSVMVRSDRAFREHVVYAPLQRSVACLEPYTCATDAFNLHARGIDAGTVVLQPGGVWRGTAQIEAET